MKFIRKYFIEIIVLLVLLLLPYYIFEGRLYIGGDDTRLFYNYPFEYIKNIAFYSWTNLSSFGANNPNQFSIPMLLAFALIGKMFHSDVFSNYLAFSLPLVIGFFSFELLMKELMGKTMTIARVGALLYIFSPISQLHQVGVFLVTIWFFAAIPLFLFLLIRYLRNNQPLYLLLCYVCGVIFSIGFYAIPWVSATILCLVLGFLPVFLMLTTFNEKRTIVKRFIVFCLFLLGSQLFWLLPFAASIIYSNAGVSGFNAQSMLKMTDTFTPTVAATATGNIMYPLLNLPHRNIAFDFNWGFKNLFIQYYDKVFALNSLYLVSLLMGLCLARKNLYRTRLKVFSGFVLSFIFSLYFFTVNVGQLINLFYFLGRLPGFVMYRNFYDKFAPSFALLSAILLCYSLQLIRKKWKRVGNAFILIIVIIIMINAFPIKKIINQPLWGTENISRNTKIPQEFNDFLKKSLVNTTNSNVISFPINIANYLVITEKNNSNSFIGTSPIRMLTGVSNLSGYMSFPVDSSSRLKSLLKEKNAEGLRDFLFSHNISQIMYIRNIPAAVYTSYLFDPEIKDLQSENFIKSFAGAVIAESNDRNYVLYSTKDKPSLFTSNEKIKFKKISPVMYEIQLSDQKNNTQLIFKDNFNVGWHIYESNAKAMTCQRELSLGNVTDCTSGDRSSFINEIGFIFRKPINSVHKPLNGFVNSWELNRNHPKNLVLYFFPQSLFYIGTSISLILFIIILIINVKYYGKIKRK